MALHASANRVGFFCLPHTSKNNAWSCFAHATHFLTRWRERKILVLLYTSKERSNRGIDQHCYITDLSSNRWKPIVMTWFVKHHHHPRVLGAGCGFGAGLVWLENVPARLGPDWLHLISGGKRVHLKRRYVTTLRWCTMASTTPRVNWLYLQHWVLVQPTRVNEHVEYVRQDSIPRWTHCVDWWLPIA